MQRSMPRSPVTAPENSIICSSAVGFLLRSLGYHTLTALVFAAAPNCGPLGRVAGGGFPRPVWWRWEARRGLQQLTAELADR